MRYNILNGEHILIWVFCLTFGCKIIPRTTFRYRFHNYTFGKIIMYFNITIFSFLNLKTLYNGKRYVLYILGSHHWVGGEKRKYFNTRKHSIRTAEQKVIYFGTIVDISVLISEIWGTGNRTTYWEGWILVLNVGYVDMSIGRICSLI